MRRLLVAIAAIVVIGLSFHMDHAVAQNSPAVTLPGNFGVQSGQASPGPLVGASGVGTPVITLPAATPDYSFSGGSVLASFVNWMWLVFGGTIVSAIMIGVRKWMALMGVEVNQKMNDRIEERIRNGLNDAAAQASVGLDGKFTVDVKNQVVAQAVDYALKHSADDLKTLGLNPDGGEVVEALRAKAESVIVDPTMATNPALVSNPKAA